MAVSGQGYEPSSAADAALDARVVSVGIWLFLAADAFFFAGWYFAFFYLRALNNNNAWIIDGLTRPNRGYGIVVMLLAVLSAASYYLASRAAGAPADQAGRPRPRPPRYSASPPRLFQGFEMWHLGIRSHPGRLSKRLQRLDRVVGRPPGVGDGVAGWDRGSSPGRTATR